MAEILLLTLKFKKIFKEVIYNLMLKNLIFMGERMSEYIWYWTKGNSKVYTKNKEFAEKAMKEGTLVMGIKVKPNVIKY